MGKPTAEQDQPDFASPASSTSPALPPERQSLEQQLKAIAAKDLSERKVWYSAAAEGYHRTRPPYPQEIRDRVRELVPLSESSTLLEIGCGPGTATVGFAPLGCSILSLEPNPEFCRIARQNCRDYPKVEICTTSFEEWALEEFEPFDAVLAATSFHWIPAEIAYPKVRQALKPGGCLILLWNVIAEPGDAVYQVTQDLYRAFAPTLAPADRPALQQAFIQNMGDQMLTLGDLGELVSGQVVCESLYSTEDYLTLLSSLSPYISLDAELRTALFDGMRQALNQHFGGKIHLSYLSAYQIARTRLPELDYPKTRALNG